VRTPGPSRAAALGAFLVFLAAQLVGLWHQASARHAVCAQHGEVVEAGPASTSAPAAGVDRDARLEASGASGEHEHCAVDGFLHQQATSASPPAAVATCTSVPAAAPLGHAAPLPALRVTDYAPKTSPPGSRLALVS
jgi:hypothetical protein